MKLISLHIENFGCLQDFDLKLEEGLTVLREDNGFGKTTLAEFIRAMFYGFPRAAKTLDKNRRKKYLPWSGGKCGGHLTFETGGTRYRIERTFGATPRGDTFNLIDLTTNQKSARFSEDIGLELFGLDSDSFERSTYLPQLSGAGPLTTDSIRAKLGDLVEDTNDVNNFDKAVKALREKRSAFVPYRGSGGSVVEARANVSRLQEELDGAEGKWSLLAQVQEQTARLEQQAQADARQLTRIREEITRASEAAAAEVVRRQYGTMEAQHGQLKGRIAGENRFPSEEELDRAERYYADYLAETARLADARLSDGDQAQLEELEQLFGPNNDSGQPRKQLERAAQLREKSRQLRELLEKAAADGKRRRKMYLLLALAAVLLGLGAVLRAAGNGAVLLVIGAAALAAGIYLAVKGRGSAKLPRKPEELQQQIGELEVQASQLEEDLKRWAPEALTPEQAVSEWEIKHGRLEDLREKQSYERSRAQHIRLDLQELSGILETFLGRYYDGVSPERFRSLLTQLRRDRDEYLRLCGRVTELEEQMTAFRAEHRAVLEAPVEPIPDAEQLKREERQLTERITEGTRRQLEQKQRAGQLQQELDRIPELRDELARWQDKKLADQQKSDTLDRTLEFLQQAKDSLSGNYLGAIQRSFSEYLGRLTGEEREKVLVTSDLEAQLERQGQVRELAYFSAGQSDLVMLCMRFALVDALFREEKPALILDDPFVNLDDARTQKALALVKELAGEWQILYLTCHSSRV